MNKEKKIKVAILGVGNCASSLVQGLTYYKNAPKEKHIVGLMHPTLGGYKIKDVKVVAAFDVNQTKVGKDLGEAIYAFPNNTKVFVKVPKLGINVQNAPIFDTIGEYVKEKIQPSEKPIIDPVQVLKIPKQKFS